MCLPIFGHALADILVTPLNDSYLDLDVLVRIGRDGKTITGPSSYSLAVLDRWGLRMMAGGRPLDWIVITDHSDMMGIAFDIQSGTPNVLAVPKGKEWHEGFQKGGKAAGEAAFDLITHFAQMKVPEKLLEEYSPGSSIYNGVWEDIIETADRFNEPGRFTALIGFEWTSVPKGFNLHRNVILRDDGSRARQVIPLTTQPPVGTQDPLDLYQWLEDYEAKTGGQALALAHNGNLSNG